MDRISLTDEQAAAIFDLTCEREAKRICGDHSFTPVELDALSGFALLRAAKERLNGLRRGTPEGRRLTGPEARDIQSRPAALAYEEGR